jgi:hypothetical protein
MITSENNNHPSFKRKKNKLMIIIKYQTNKEIAKKVIVAPCKTHKRVVGSLFGNGDNNTETLIIKLEIEIFKTRV